MGGRSTSKWWVSGAGLLLLSIAGCAPGGQYRSDSDWTTDEQTRLHGVGEPEDLTGARGSSGAPDLHHEWVGVRHDIIIAPNHPRVARCNCLAVEVGRPEEQKFRWQGNVPPDFPGDKLAVAISTRGVDCPGGNADETKRRPSISAIDQRGSDIVIEVEELPTGRPVASGAIVRHPQGDGGIYVRAKSKKLPYARQQGNKLRDFCRVY